MTADEAANRAWRLAMIRHALRQRIADALLRALMYPGRRW